MKNTWYILLLMSIIILLSTCKKTPEIPTGSKIEIGETTLDSVSYYTAKISTDIKSVGNTDIIQYGHCWSREEEPTTTDYKTELGSTISTGSFYDELIELKDSTTYHIRPYITYQQGTLYGNELTVKTLETRKPTVTTGEITEITTYSALCTGINDDGGLPISTRGVCWDETGSPSINGPHDDCAGGVGSFSITIVGLDEGFVYYVAAYAINEKGIVYGETKQFTTLPVTVPVVETSPVINVTSNSAESGGNVISNGNESISKRGVCWNKTGNPRLENCIDRTIDFGQLGSFTGVMSGLEENTHYYFVAYATNTAGAGYGEVLEFTTQELIPCGTYTVEYGGQTYHTVKIGDQCWMKENLNIGTRIDGTQNMQDNQIIEKYCYSDDEANCDVYGGLYQWDEMMKYTISEGDQGICPTGWHIPTDGEWKILEGIVDSQYGVGDPEWDIDGAWRGFDAGSKLKSVSGWASDGNGTDSYGFKALPSGFWFNSNQSFFNLYDDCYWWTSTEFNESSSSYQRELDKDNPTIVRYKYFDKNNAVSIRCLRD